MVPPQSGKGPRDQESALLERIAELEDKLEEVLTRSEKIMEALVRATKLLTPFLVVGLMLAFTWALFPDRFGEALARFGAGIVFGKIAAAGASGDFLYWLFVMGTLDVMIGLFFIWNVDVVYKLPWAGDKFRKMENVSNYFLAEHGWMRRAAFLGVTIWILIPLHGTGSITGSVLGRLLGLGAWRTFLALTIAAYTGVALVLSGTAVAAVLGQVNPVFMGLFLLTVFVLLVALWWRYVHQVQQRKKAQMAAGPHEPEEVL
jgi:uncharacterized membrane protein